MGDSIQALEKEGRGERSGGQAGETVWLGFAVWKECHAATIKLELIIFFRKAQLFFLTVNVLSNIGGAHLLLIRKAN